MSVSQLRVKCNTHIDENLCTAKRKVRGRKMLPNLCDMRTVVVLNSADVK
jgi:hypothetical protein